LIDVAKFWTFPVPGTDAFMAVARDWEGFVFLNPTAAWIWQNLSITDLYSAYSKRFEITLEQSRSDVEGMFANWAKWPPPPVSYEAEIHTTIALIDRNIRFKLGDVTFLLQFLTSGIADEVIPRVSNLKPSQLPPDHTFVLSEQNDGVSISLNGSLLGVEPFVNSARGLLLQEVARLATPCRTFRAILHAGVVGDAKGCVILAGASFSGKSTLCAALMQAGYTCYGEDSAALTPAYQVAGMPFAISLRKGSWHLFPQLERPRFIPSNLNGDSPMVPPVGIVLVEYDSQAEALHVEEVNTFDALVSLQHSGFWIEHTHTGVESFLQWISNQPIYRLRYSNLNAAVAQVAKFITDPKPS